MILSICMDYLQVRNARKTIFRVRRAVREEHSRPLNLRWLWPCPSVWTTCSMNFKSSSKWFTAILVREVFLEIFLRERASEPRSGDIAGNELRSAEERKVFFSLSSQFRNGDLFISGNQRFEHQFSFGKSWSVGALRTNRRHECTATTELSFVAWKKNFCFC